MVSCEKIKKVFYIICASLCLALLGVCFFYSDFSNKIYAEENNVPSYLSIIKTERDGSTTSHINNDTIFLDTYSTTETSDKITITLGINEENPEIALKELENFSLRINGIEKKNTDWVKTLGFAVNQQLDYQYLEIEINLADTFFTSGEYVLSFNEGAKYSEYNSADGYDTPVFIAFSVTLYIFQTSEYFNEFNSQNVTYDNVNESNEDTGLYKNYYYFNYSNINTLDNNSNYLPTLTFDANKFIVNVSKTYDTKTESISISKTSYSESITSITDIVFASINGNNITICFNDLGDYEINYTFIYNDVSKVLKGPEIRKVSQEADILYVYGYQMFYSGVNKTSNNEFKVLNTNSFSINNSADISYLTSSENTIEYDNVNFADFLNDDTAILASLPTTAVSTNQAPINLKTNANFYSGYYYYNNNGFNASDIASYEKTNFRGDIPFTSNGTYLLKLIYTYNNYQSNLYFCQYFFFTITSISPDILINEDNEEHKTIDSDVYTNQDVKITLPANSIYDSPVSVKVFSKSFNGSYNYDVPDAILTASTTPQYATCTEEDKQGKNYQVIIYFGTNNKSIINFTIDKTEIQNIEVVPVSNTTTKTNWQLKSNSIDFFTEENVVVQWDKKLSQAQTYAYYKFIPFKMIESVSSSNKNLTYTRLNENIPTNYALDFSVGDLEKNIELSKTSYINAKSTSRINNYQVLSNQGYYVMYIFDEAGNEQHLSFCIDKTSMKIWQCDENTNYIDETLNFNVVSSDTNIQWGAHKLIKLNIKTNEIENIVDEWLKQSFKDLYSDYELSLVNTQTTSRLKINLTNNSEKNDMYFQVKISDFKVIQIGNNANLYTNSFNNYLIKKMNEDDTFAMEITYIIYLIDESSYYYTMLDRLYGSINPNYTQNDFINNFIENSDINYDVTVSTDISQINILINPNNTNQENINGIDKTCNSLIQAGFADSVLENTNTLRSKYFMATGVSGTNTISMLTYIFKPLVEDSINHTTTEVQKIIMYYYPFVNDTVLGIQKLKTTPSKSVVIYQKDSTNNLVLNLGGEFGSEGFVGYNINPIHDINTSTYRTENGKYVFVREYTDSTTIDTSNDFKVRENVFMVDRENIVSNPEQFNNELKSYVGGDIFINVLDGDTDAVAFKDIYASKYNNSYILQTNKLPVVAYIPISKYGTIDNNKYIFKSDEILSYYLQVSSDNKLIRYQEDNNNITSTLTRIYFGKDVITSDYNNKKTQFFNDSFSLDVKITNSNGKSFSASLASGFIKSETLFEAGTYYVEIIQNLTQGKNYPNVYQTFKFSFQIIESPPEFTFTTINGLELNTDSDGISYTNQNIVRVHWTNPADTTYMAKIDIAEENAKNIQGKLYAKGIYYYINNQDFLTYVKLSQIIITDSGYYFDISLSSASNGSVLYVYMQYEGFNSLYKDATSTTKKVYIDYIAPEKIIQEFINSTNINNYNFAENSMHYVTADNAETETSSQLYYVRKTTGVLGNYYFAIIYDRSALAQLFSLQGKSNNGYYTEGAYYYINQINDNFEPTKITNAIDASITSQVSVANLQAGKKYEIIEKDYAGNVTIFNIYIVPNSNDSVLEFTKNGVNGSIGYADLMETQNIYSIAPFALTKINLNNYSWLTFSLDDNLSSDNSNTYFKSPLLDNAFYNNAINDYSKTPTKTFSLEELNNIFKPSTTNTYYLKIVGPSKYVSGKIVNTIYNFNINVVDSKYELNVDLHENDQGITITAYDNIFPTKIIIYSYENTEFAQIYNYEKGNYQTNGYILYSYIEDALNNDNPNNKKIYYYNYVIDTSATSNEAYKYEIFDNFGRQILKYKTVNSIDLDESQEIIGYQNKQSIVVNKTTENWYVGLNNIIFNFNYYEFFAYIKFEYLQFNTETNTFYWGKVPITSLKENANLGYQINPNQDTKTNFFNTKQSSLGSSIEQIELLKMNNILGLDSFVGGIIKFEITLVNTRETSSINNKKINILINTLEPKISLFDRNNEDITNSLIVEKNAQYYGNVTIRVGNSNFAQTSTGNDDVQPFAFEYKTTITFNNIQKALASGTVVKEPGTYVINNYIIIGETEKLINTYSFRIFESSDAFFTVVSINPDTLEEVIIESQEIDFTDIRPDYLGLTYKHYIVNTEFNIYGNTNEAIFIDKNNYTALIEQSPCKTYIYTISNINQVATHQGIRIINIQIAISYIPKPKEPTTILSGLTYVLSDTENNQSSEFVLDNQAKTIIINDTNSEYDSIVVKFNSFYVIKENTIDFKIYYGDGQKIIINPEIIYEQRGTIVNAIASFKINKTGIYYIEFKDKAGNIQVFSDASRGNITNYQINFIKGVAYNINGNIPIENAIYNNQVVITLANNFKNLYNYDTGNKPSIKVFKNGTEISVTANSSGEYILTESGYYKVYFNAKIQKNSLKEEAYQFTIISSNEFLSDFEFSQYGDYTITKILKNGIEQDYSNNNSRLLKNLNLSIYDEKTGIGVYEITIATNSTIQNEEFTFNITLSFIKSIPIEISIPKNSSTTNTITVGFNVRNMYKEIGDCKVVVGNKTLKINQDLVDSLTDNTYQSYDITETGTYFIQIYSSSNNLLYSYKVIKTEPLNAVSIILIVVAVGTVVSLVVTISLLRKKMKIR